MLRFLKHFRIVRNGIGANVPFCTLQGYNATMLLWTITTKKGAKAIDTRNLSSKKWEEELLFDRSQKLEINEIKYNNRYKIWEIDALIVTE